MQFFSKKFVWSVTVVWGAALFLLLLGYMVLIRPQNLAVKKTKNQIENKTEEYRVAQDCSKEQTKARMKDKLRASQDRLAEFVVDTEQAAGLTFDISQIADRLKVDGFNSKRKASESYMEIDGCSEIGKGQIEVAFLADFPQFAKFVNMLERNIPVIFVDEFYISPKMKNLAEHDVRMTLAYFVRKT